MHVVDRTPLILQDIQTDPPREIYVGMIDGRLEDNRRRGVGVRGGEVKGEFEFEPLVIRSLGSDDGRGPTQKISVGVGERGNARSGGHHELHEFSLESRLLSTWLASSGRQKTYLFDTLSVSCRLAGESNLVASRPPMPAGTLVCVSIAKSIF